MKLVVEIDCSNDAFGRNPSFMVSQLLMALARRIGSKPMLMDAPIVDPNGNTVGQAKWVKE